MFDPQALIAALPKYFNRALIDKGTSIEAIALQLEDRKAVKIALRKVDIGERNGYWREGPHVGAPRLDIFDRDMELLAQCWNEWVAVTSFSLNLHHPRVVIFSRK